jgi:hypothetical protein
VGGVSLADGSLQICFIQHYGMGPGDSFGFLLAFCWFLGLSLAWTVNICYSLYDNHEHFAGKFAHLLIEIVLFLIAVSSPLLPMKLSILRTTFKV